MKLQKYFLAIALFTVALTSAQIRSFEDYNLIQQNGPLDRGRLFSEEELAKIKGSPFESEGAFVIGTVYKDNQKVVENVLMRHNAYTNHIETSSGGNIPTGTLLKDPAAVVEIGAKTYVFFSEGTSPKKAGYFELISEEANGSLYKKYGVNYIDAVKGKDTYTADKPARFKNEVTYYLVDNNTKFTALPQNKRKILEAFGNKESEMKKYVKANKLNLSKEKDLSKAITHYFSL